MQIGFRDRDLERLEFDTNFNYGKSMALIRAFRKVMNFIRQAESSRDLYAFKSLKIEKLQGKRKNQRSMRLNDQFRLIVEFGEEKGVEKIWILAIEDYHQ
jgi:toxin HigB-1